LQAQAHAVIGHALADVPGTYDIVWDNSYSMFRKKTLTLQLLPVEFGCVLCTQEFVFHVTLFALLVEPEGTGSFAAERDREYVGVRATAAAAAAPDDDDDDNIKHDNDNNASQRDGNNA
jgi:hypothetical protein